MPESSALAIPATIAGKPSRLFVTLALTAVLLLGTGPWAYLYGVLDPYWRTQRANSVAGAYHSDFFPSWVATRETLTNRADPYSKAVTEKIQRDYYGHPLSAESGDDPQAFVYPAHIMFLIAPLALLPFRIAEPLFFLILLLMALWLIPLFMSAFAIPWNRRVRWLAILVLFASFPLAEALYVEQFTLVVVFAIAAAIAALVKGHQLLAGMLLAVSTIKPQMSSLLLVWLMLWAITRWRDRRRLLTSFLLSAALMVLGAELLLPGWVTRWLNAAGAYLRYPNRRTLAAWLLPKPLSFSITALITLAALFFLWGLRTAESNQERFRFAIALSLATALVMMPTWPFLLYNQLLLVPTMLLVAKGSTRRPFSMGRVLSLGLAAALACSSAFALLIAVLVLALRIPELKLIQWLDLPFFNFGLVPLLAALTLIATLWNGREGHKLCHSKLPMKATCNSGQSN